MSKSSASILTLCFIGITTLSIHYIVREDIISENIVNNMLANTPNESKSLKNQKKRLDSFILNSKTEQYSSQNGLEYILFSETSKNFESSNSTQLSKPVFYYYSHTANNDKKNATNSNSKINETDNYWHAKSDSAIANHYNQTITMTGNAIINQTKQSLHISSQYFEIDTYKHTIKTNDAVELRQGKNTTHAIGMLGNINTNQLSLFNQVKSYYPPNTFSTSN